MKKLTLFILLFPIALFSQIGIGTVLPQETLHVAGTGRFDTLPVMTVGYKHVVADIDGKLGLADIVPTGGMSFEYGENIADDNLLFHPNFVGTSVHNDINLDLQISVTVPPGTSHITVEYSVPLGAQNCLHPGMQMLSYIGVTFYRDGVETRKANRKIALIPRPSAPGLGTICSMGFVTCSYDETVVNNTNLPIVIIYEAMGYLEQHWASPSIPYIWNMWLPFSGANYNWGDAYIKYRKITF